MASRNVRRQRSSTDRVQTAVRRPPGIRRAAYRATATQLVCLRAARGHDRSRAALPRSGSATPEPSPRGKRKRRSARRRGSLRRHHLRELGFVGGRHDHQTRQASQISESKEPACVGPSAPTSPARSIAKRTGRLLDRDVVHDLVVGALQERRVDRARTASCLRSPCRRRTSPHAARRCRRRRSLGKLAAKHVEAGPRWHCGRDRRRSSGSSSGFLDQAVGEHRV